MSADITLLAAALSKAQGAMTPAIKDSTNPHFKSKYADLASCWEAARAPLRDNGLAVLQTFEPVEAGICLVTTLVHSSGQWVQGKLVLYPTKNDPQGYGSAITYGRRYALMAMLGIAPDDDDDGEGASGRPQAQAPKSAPLKPVQAVSPIAPVQAHSNAYCEACDTELVLGESGKGYFCPKHETPGNHTKFLAGYLQEFLIKQSQGVLK